MIAVSGVLGVMPVALIAGDSAPRAVTFVAAARRYWLEVFPRVCRERRRGRARALAIPDPLLRRVALEAQGKWGNVEGAAAFAAFAPRGRRAAATRAMASFQAAYNYLDLLGEHPSADPAANGRRLHGALLVALDPGDRLEMGRHEDYYADSLQRDDGGYLAQLVDACRAALATLPSYALVAPAARRAGERIVAFQSCNTGELGGDFAALRRWAQAAAPPGEGLRWWEAAAAGGSSLCVYALIALAAEPDVDPAAPAAIEAAYFPWIGALHSLLDNLVDVAEDHATGQHSLIGRYDSPGEAAERMGMLAERALSASQALVNARAHMLVLSAMAGFYLSAPEARTPAALPVARAVREALDGPVGSAMLVFRARMLARRLRSGSGAADPGGRARAQRGLQSS
jgi:tetraprenyl-beta-curcumene synthase